MNYLFLKPGITPGISDQIILLISAVAYAHLTGRTLVLDWHFEIKDVGVKLPILDSQPVKPAAWT